MQHKHNIRINDKSIWTIVFLCLGIGAIFLIISLNQYGSEKILDSDMASELVLAKLSAQEHSFISENWYYPTELRVISAQLIYVPLAKVFVNWSSWRFVSTVVSLCALIASYFLFCVKLESRWLFITSIPVLLASFSYVYYYELYLALFYTPYVVTAFITFSLTFMTKWEKYKKKALTITFLNGCVALLAGMSGLRELFQLYVPACLAATMVLLARHYKYNKNEESTKLLEQPGFNLFIATFSGLSFAAIGFFINNYFLSRQYSFLSWNDRVWISFDLDRLMTAVKGLFEVFGYTVGEINAATLIKNAVAISLVLVGIGSTIFLVICKKDNIKESHRFFALFNLLNLLILLNIYALTNMDYAERYNIPVIIMLIPTTVLALSYVKINSQRRNALLLVFCCICMASGGLTRNTLLTLDKTVEFEKITTSMERKEVFYGLASFWDCNVLTEISDGKIDMRCYGDFQDSMEWATDITDTFKWLAEKRHDGEFPQGKVAVVFRTEGFDTFYAKNELLEKEPIYLSESYRVIAFENYYEMLKTLSNYEFSFADGGRWVINGYDEEGKRLLDKGGVSYGPYITLYEGEYTVTFNGCNLKTAAIDCVFEEDATGTIPLEEVERTNNTIKCTMKLDGTCHYVQTRVVNSMEDLIELDSIKIEHM